MRYTTIIDIAEIPAVYRNVNARLLYLHMVLKAGYHDEDRDICALSIRRLAVDCGLTVSAVRHALKILAKYQLIEQHEGITIVRKWVESKTVSKRQPKNSNSAAAERKKEEERAAARESEHKAFLQDLKAQGKSSLDAYFEMLEKRAAAGDTDAAETLRRRRAEHQRTKQEKN